MGVEWGNEEIINKGFIVELVTPPDGSSSGDSEEFCFVECTLECFCKEGKAGILIRQLLISII